MFHGHAHGVELPSSSSPVEYCVGFVFGTGLLHAIGIAISLIEVKPYGKAILRSCGAAIGAVGCFYLFSQDETEMLYLLQSPEMSLGAVCFALFVSRSPQQEVLKATLLSAMSIIISMATMLYLVKDVLPMTSASLVSLILTGMITCSGKKLKNNFLAGYSAVFGALYGLSSFELFIDKLGLIHLAWTTCCFLLITLAVYTAVSKFKQPGFVIAQRVLSSWIAAAGILMLAFFI